MRPSTPTVVAADAHLAVILIDGNGLPTVDGPGSKSRKQRSVHSVRVANDYNRSKPQMRSSSDSRGAGGSVAKKGM